jgi:hypothetical protein
MLTFSQLWDEMNKNVRKRPWLLSLIAIDQLEMVSSELLVAQLVEILTLN